MKRFLLLTVVLIFAISGPTFGAIVYSGSRNVTLTLDPPMMMASMTINVAMSTDAWDDFTVDLWYDRMGMSHLAISAPGSMMGMGMGMGGIGIMGMGSFASNLMFGDMIGTNLSFVDWSPLYDDGGGEFGADGGYIGLMMVEPNPLGGEFTYYGWLHMLSLSNPSVTFDGWAYENVPGTGIGAGAIPVPGAIVLAGLGTGFVIWLRRRRAL